MLNTLLTAVNKPVCTGMEMSYSRINTYKTCSWKYRLIYIEGRHLPPNPFISLGLSMHRALEDFHTRKAQSFDELLESYNASWVNEGFGTPQQVQDFFEKGQRMLENYWVSNRDDKNEILFLEKDFNFELGRNRLRGIIDRIDRRPDGTYEVIDYKTHAELWSSAKVDSDLQLSIYALACEKSLGFAPGALSYYFLAHNRKMSTVRTKEQIEQALVTVEETAEKIINKEFVPCMTHCPKCDFKHICPHSAKNRARHEADNCH